MRRYNYFGENDNQYYVRNLYTIEIYLDCRNNYIFALPEGLGFKTYTKKGNGYRLTDWTDHRSAKFIGSMQIQCGLKKCKSWFDPSNPILPTASGVLHEYEYEFFEENDEEIKSDLYYPHIFRNNQYIGPMRPLSKLKPSSGRANPKERLKNSLIRTENLYIV